MVFLVSASSLPGLGLMAEGSEDGSPNSCCHTPLASEYLLSQLSRLKPGGRRSEKAGLEGGETVCILVHETLLL